MSVFDFLEAKHRTSISHEITDNKLLNSETESQNQKSESHTLESNYL